MWQLFPIVERVLAFGRRNRLPHLTYPEVPTRHTFFWPKCRNSRRRLSSRRVSSRLVICHLDGLTARKPESSRSTTRPSPQRGTAIQYKTTQTAHPHRSP